MGIAVGVTRLKTRHKLHLKTIQSRVLKDHPASHVDRASVPETVTSFPLYGLGAVQRLSKKLILPSPLLLASATRVSTVAWTLSKRLGTLGAILKSRLITEITLQKDNELLTFHEIMPQIAITKYTHSVSSIQCD